MTIQQQLAAIAAFIDRFGLKHDEVISCGVLIGEMQIHLRWPAFKNLARGFDVSKWLNETAWHCEFRCDGIRVSAIYRPAVSAPVFEEVA